MTHGLLKYSAIAIVLVVTPAAAQSPFTAQTLYSLCSPDTTEAKSDREAAETKCGTYILGLTDGMFMMQLLASHSMTPCMPKEAAIDIAKARQIFDDYFKAHPQAARNSAGLVMGMALADAYKCKGN